MVLYITKYLGLLKCVFFFESFAFSTMMGSHSQAHFSSFITAVSWTHLLFCFIRLVRYLCYPFGVQWWLTFSSRRRKTLINRSHIFALINERVFDINRSFNLHLPTLTYALPINSNNRIGYYIVSDSTISCLYYKSQHIWKRFDFN